MLLVVKQRTCGRESRLQMTSQPEDPIGLVRRGYDVIADRYAAARHPEPPPLFDQLAKRLGMRSEILDAGCGAAEPVGARLASRGFRVTGLDISAEQLRLAWTKVTGLGLTQGDLQRLP